MRQLTSPGPVKLLIGMISQETALLDELKGRLADIFGAIDLESPVWPWDHTKYYEKEMGAGLKRQFIFFERLIRPDEISGIKLTTIDLEKQLLNENRGRRINLDPGYLDEAKLVLVSVKNFSHKIYLDKGIYGEVTLYYEGKTYRPLPYTFPDYKTDAYIDVFKKARGIYRTQI